MNTNENAITVKELRAILFNIENQEMTVRELRAMLFTMDDKETVSETTTNRLNMIEAAHLEENA